MDKRITTPVDGNRQKLALLKVTQKLVIRSNGKLARPDAPNATSGDMTFRTFLPLCALVLGCQAKPAVIAPSIPAPGAQNPSPMVETARKHERITPGAPAGVSFTIDSLLPRPVEVFLPERTEGSDATSERTLLVHLFGAAFVPMSAVVQAGGNYVLATVNLGGGSSAYERPLSDSAAWIILLDRLRAESTKHSGNTIRTGRVIVSAFSAGYGGVRALLSNERIAATLDGVVLLDGLHTSYIPERTVLSEGGVLDSAKLFPFLSYAERAVAGKAKLVITHSEIFPGTFASTTETTDWLVSRLGLSRTPVLAWGPGGMQQISEVKRGGLWILGFAGNTGPDHIDHLHGLGEFLRRTSEEF